MNPYYIKLTNPAPFGDVPILTWLTIETLYDGIMDLLQKQVPKSRIIIGKVAVNNDPLLQESSIERAYDTICINPPLTIKKLERLLEVFFCDKDNNTQYVACKTFKYVPVDHFCANPECACAQRRIKCVNHE